MKSNEILQKEVQEAIKFEPLLHAAEIGVIVKDAIVTLTGHVDSLVKKTEALHAAKKIKGIAAIVDEIEVILEKSSAVSDQQIAEQLVSIFKENHIVPKGTISIIVEKGWVTLEGLLPWNFQRDIARELVENQIGVIGVTNNWICKQKLEKKLSYIFIIS